MPDRLSAREISLLAADSQHTPAHAASLDVFEADHDFAMDRVVDLIADRLAYVPRYRKLVRTVPASVAAPVWVDDEDFDLSFHVRRSALPRPGTEQQLREFAGRVVARKLDHDRPLWEAYLVEGLQSPNPDRQRFALVTKTHLALVNGVDDVDLCQVLLDDVPDVEPLIGGEWTPEHEPSAGQLLIDAVVEAFVDPRSTVDTVRRQATEAIGLAVNVGEAVGGVGSLLSEVAGNLLRGGRAPVDSPIAGWVSSQRRVASAEIDLEQVRALHEAHQVTVNDIVLTVLTGALRLWLTGRGDERRRDLVAMVPMSVPDMDGQPTSLGSRVAPHLMTLPLGEADPLMRLHQVAYGTRAHTDTGRTVRARDLIDIAGFAPGTLHALAGRVAGEVLRRQHDVVISNAPGPQRPLYAAGAELIASYPVQPLSPGHLLAIGITSYHGRIFVGFTADRDQLGDVDQLAACVPEAVAELLATQEGR
ncbi:MAG: wax ester/triacylglycerol synthase family O-acyltransferase [Propionibacterium sp.]|nr:wax ester/triacylglycerol synthase family O-acyltransferase [Propionibacterium sp.]